MALPLRNDLSTAPVSPPLAPAAPPPDAQVAASFQPGGQVGQMQADLAARLAGIATVVPAADRPEERFVRFVSVTGGYVALAAAYAGVAMLFLR